ncbi:adenylyl-sulfate kinase [Filobacillus milosensis]|uniref:Adenylyl-sulfate kinase n=1 Tax=Filobacillus milosensis TaxID=94137 RepID=A0A4Y8ISF3_9BACI|nr:kinase [Filobacillus milosensis]TFB21707.1 adenylyl-sulfate kinase [Filobacillus milosensis]
MIDQQLIHRILDEHKNYKQKRPFIVAIDGLSGAGKTTISNQIENELTKRNISVAIFHIDDHIVERKHRYNTGYEEWYEYYYLQWDVKLLQQKLFKALHNESKLTLPFYNHSTDTTLYKTVNINSSELVLIEGIFLQREEWLPYIDYVVYIDCPREIRFERALNRDTYIGDYQERLYKYKRRYWQGEDHYLNHVNPLKRADFSINSYHQITWKSYD